MWCVMTDCLLAVFQHVSGQALRAVLDHACAWGHNR